MAEGIIRFGGFAWTFVDGTAMLAGRRQKVKILHCEDAPDGVTVELIFGERDWAAFQRRVADEDMEPQVEVFDRLPAAASGGGRT